MRNRLLMKGIAAFIGAAMVVGLTMQTLAPNAAQANPEPAKEVGQVIGSVGWFDVVRFQDGDNVCYVTTRRSVVALSCVKDK